MHKALGISEIMFLDEIPGSEVAESRVCPAGRPTGAAEIVGPGGAGRASSGLWARKAAARCLLTYPSRAQQANSVGRQRRRRPELGALAARVPAMAESVERLQQWVEELERELAQERSRRALGGSDGGRRWRRRSGPHRKDEPRSGGFQPLQPLDGIEMNGNCK